MEYFIWKALAGKGAAVFTDLQNTDDVISIKRGRKLTTSFSDNAFFEMNARYPKDKLLEDQVSNMDKMVLISPKFADFLRDKALSEVELLNVNIKDHQGNFSSEIYAIVHTTKVVDCIDQDNSDLVWNKIDPDLISGCYALVLDDEKIGDDDKIFRLKHLEPYLIVREDFRDTINTAGFTGVNMIEIDEFEA